VEWAEQIKPRVDGEFERVAKAFAGAAEKQPEAVRQDTLAIISIVQMKREEVMARNEAGYFIKEWQELGDQVRKLVFRDPGFAAIQERREARKSVEGTK
jgi:hypothetical protein